MSAENGRETFLRCKIEARETCQKTLLEQIPVPVLWTWEQTQGGVH